jgi:hypothetical protein
MQRRRTEMDETTWPIRFTARERSEPAEGGGGSGRASEPRGAKAPPFLDSEDGDAACRRTRGQAE